MTSPSNGLTPVDIRRPLFETLYFRTCYYLFGAATRAAYMPRRRELAMGSPSAPMAQI